MRTESGNKQEQSTPPTQQEGSSLLTFQLAELTQQLKEEENWQKSGRGARTLYKSDAMCIVLNVMQAGTEIKPHHTAGPISVQVVEGRIRFNTEKESVVLGEGQLLTLQEHVRHNVEALKETAFLLSMSPLATKA
ncbi:cupin domain-containing protein [Pontibacter roseus]|uniref:cupin domain-containing protein n=1 Tax=Pontibacter roseus TaxID=336989 RepID=UPI0003606D87|nr:cupin domain-containing protein [Pontibacter roseus]